MKNIKLFFLSLVVMLFPFFGFALIHDQQAIKTRMINDLEIIRNTFEIRYAPAEWKKTYADLNIDELIRQAKIQIIAADEIKVGDFQRILKKFFKSLRDYHVAVRFYSSASSFLPFRLQKAQGKYFITWVDSNSNLQINEGDEVISFNDKPIDVVIEEFKEKELGNLGSETDQKLAELFLTNRVGTLGHEVLSGNVKLVTRPRYYADVESEEFLKTDEITWDFVPEKISHGPYQMAFDQVAFDFPDFDQTFLPNNIKEYFSRQMLPSFYHPLMAATKKQSELNSNVLNDSEKIRYLGRRKSILPPLGEIVWQSEEENPFHAYLFKTSEGKTAGYVRIPTYVGCEDHAKEFAKIINHFENEVEILVVDQFDNPGGIVFYMYALASMLSNQPLEVMTHRITITQEDAFFAIEALKILDNPDLKEVSKDFDFEETVDGYFINDGLMKSLQNHFQLILNEWNTGFTFTSPTHLFGIETINPHPWGCFSKPILFLTNELNFSCADFLPALLQDNKRATLMGAKTAGAGGFVLNHSFPNRFGIGDYTFTGSIAERVDGNPIENLGVTPDILYELTQRDLTDGYIDYISAIQTVVDQLLPKPIEVVEEPILIN